MKSLIRVFLVVWAVFSGPSFTVAQSKDWLSIKLQPEASIPILGSTDLYKVGAGITTALDMNLFPWLAPTLEFGYGLHPTFADENVTATTVGLGFNSDFSITNRLLLGFGGVGGVYQAQYVDDSMADFFGKAYLNLAYRLSPAFSLSVSGSYQQLLAPSIPLYQGAGVGLTATLNLSGLRGGTNISAGEFKFDPIFPIFYSHYDKNKLGSFTLKNLESGSIQDVRVSFLISQFMEQPKACAEYPRIKQGATMEVPIYALFTDDVLKLTESAKTSAEIIVEYTFLDSRRTARFNETLRINHRNALVWDDDQKAAAFVSAKDPAVLRYSKYAAGIIRESGQSEINQNLRFAMGLFEGLRLYGVNYVVDPTTPYKELSENTNALDYLQFPNQTLTYRGGDCDDLSILFSSILESVGIKTAFITIPGHIYMAFSLDIAEKEATSLFANTGDLLFIDDTTWLPLEVTAINDSFIKAWQIGAKEWYDNHEKGLAKLIRIHDAWNQYEPVGIPGEDTRIVLPDQHMILTAYDAILRRFIAQEVEPRAAKIKLDIMASGNNARQVNRLGVLYARYNMLEQAKAEFEKAGKQGYGPSISNLGNIYYLQKKYPEAIHQYQAALALVPSDKTALIGLARSQYETENYAESSKAYALVQKSDPSLAGQYPYLVSRTDGAARASSAGERGGKAAWNED